MSSNQRLLIWFHVNQICFPLARRNAYRHRSKSLFLVLTKSPKENPNYHADWKDKSGTHWIQFKPVTTNMDVFVSGEELVKILNYGVTDGELLPPTWDRDSSRVDLFCYAFQPVLPAHFPPTHERDAIQNLEQRDEIQKGKRGGIKENHPFLAHYCGKCRAYVDGCRARYDL